jgi:hypothetical protein
MLFLFLPLGSLLGIKGKDFYLILFLRNNVVFFWKLDISIFISSPKSFSLNWYDYEILFDEVLLLKKILVFLKRVLWANIGLFVWNMTKFVYRVRLKCDDCYFEIYGKYEITMLPCGLFSKIFWQIWESLRNDWVPENNFYVVMI